MNAHKSGMTMECKHPIVPPLPELGRDMLQISGFQLLLTIVIPFFCVAIYFVFSANEYWAAAVLALMGFSFFTYGSTSHDLVHANLGLSRKVNDLLLSLIELLALRSGHAYRLAHLHHHARFPHEDDVEAATCRMSLFRTLLEGPIAQVRIWIWAVQRAKQDRIWVVWEGAGCVLLFVAAAMLYPVTPIFLGYALLVIMGSWVFPLVTVYVPHDPTQSGILFQTRVFRGVVASVIGIEHLYHLEHHLYPSVPHQNWPELARRLDPYLQNAGVQPIKLWF